jgi:hypothetical protein
MFHTRCTGMHWVQTCGELEKCFSSSLQIINVALVGDTKNVALHEYVVYELNELHSTKCAAVILELVVLADGAHARGPVFWSFHTLNMAARDAYYRGPGTFCCHATSFKMRDSGNVFKWCTCGRLWRTEYMQLFPQLEGNKLHIGPSQAHSSLRLFKRCIDPGCPGEPFSQAT